VYNSFNQMHDIFKKKSVIIDIYAYCHLNCNISPERGGNYKLLVTIMQSLIGSCDSIVSIVTRLCTGQSGV